MASVLGTVKQTRFRGLGAETQKTDMLTGEQVQASAVPAFTSKEEIPAMGAEVTVLQGEARSLLYLAHPSIVLYMQGTGPHCSKHFTNINSFISYNNSLEIDTIIIPI